VFHADALQKQSHKSTLDGKRWFSQKHWKGVFNLSNDLQEKFLNKIQQMFLDLLLNKIQPFFLNIHIITHFFFVCMTLINQNILS